MKTKKRRLFNYQKIEKKLVGLLDKEQKITVKQLAKDLKYEYTTFFKNLKNCGLYEAFIEVFKTNKTKEIKPIIIIDNDSKEEDQNYEKEQKKPKGNKALVEIIPKVILMQIKELQDTKQLISKEGLNFTKTIFSNINTHEKKIMLNIINKGKMDISQ